MVQLSEMFPSFDTDVLRMVITENGGNMEKAIASLLIMSGDDNPELIKTIKKDTSLDISEESERELQSLERRYGLNLHRTWRTRLPKDLLIIHVAPSRRGGEFQSGYPSNPQFSGYNAQGGYPNRTYASFDPQGTNFSYYIPGDHMGAPVSISSLGRDIKDKWSNFINRKKGYQLTKTTED